MTNRTFYAKIIIRQKNRIFTHLNIASYGWIIYIAIADPIAQSPAASNRKAPVCVHGIENKNKFMLILVYKSAVQTCLAIDHQ